MAGKRKEPRYYMEMAIQVMKNSIPERHQENPSPSVGAVLVFPDGEVSTASRGQLREGDHAEYTVLDKLNRHRDLSECWLFATLEPCAPGARKFPKLSCATRIVSARIPKVWFGVQELNSKAKGGKAYLEKMGIEVMPFDSDLLPEIRKFNKGFNDWVEEEECKRQEQDTPVAEGFLSKIAEHADVDSLSSEALAAYIERSGKKYPSGSKELYRDLMQKGLLIQPGDAPTLIPSGDAILLFGKNPRDQFPQAAVKAKVDYGTGDIDTQSFDDALVLVPNQVEQWLRKVIPESFDRRKFISEKTPHFPPEIIREAVINALVHRDYSLPGAKIQLEIHPDRIIVKSPGAPYSPNSLEKLQNFTAVSYARNENTNIAYIFNIMRLMEETGVGMDTFRSLREKHQLPLPVITYDGLNTVFTFPRSVDAIRDLVQTVDQAKLKDEELIGYDYIKSVGKITRKEYQIHFKLDQKMAERHLSKMVALGLLERKGAGPGTYYEVIAT